MGEARQRTRVIAHAFACDPERGSEAGGAWGTVNALSEWADVVTLVSHVHSESIQAWQRRHPNPSLRFVGVPFRTARRPGLRRVLPKWLRRGERWLRYWRWQKDARDVALRLHQEEPFDVAIHASLGIHWQPSTVIDLPLPRVWGPVSGGSRSPPSLWPFIGVAGVALEWLETVLADIVASSPLTRRTRQLADVTLIESEAVRSKLPAKLRGDALVVNRAMMSRIRDVADVPRQSSLVFTSPLEKRKGPSLALAALTHAPKSVRLAFIHEGPEEPELRRLARRWGVADRVEFRGRVPRDEMWDTIASAAACVFTGPSDEGGCALAEAMLAGAPVVVLGNGGQRVMAEASTDATRTAIIDPSSPRETARLLGRAMADFAASPPTASGAYLDQDGTKKRLRAALELAMRRHQLDGR